MARQFVNPAYNMTPGSSARQPGKEELLRQLSKAAEAARPMKPGHQVVTVVHQSTEGPLSKVEVIPFPLLTLSCHSCLSGRGHCRYVSPFSAAFPIPPQVVGMLPHRHSRCRLLFLVCLMSFELPLVPCPLLMTQRRVLPAIPLQLI